MPSYGELQYQAHKRPAIRPVQPVNWLGRQAAGGITGPGFFSQARAVA